MTLLERDTELALLRASFARARSGDGRFVLIAGEAGIGKTALARAFGDQLPRGERLLIGTCDPLSAPSAHAPLHDLQTALGIEVESLLRERAEPGHLFPAVLAAMQRMPGAAFLIEDIHWADDGTLDLLRYLSRRIERLPVLILATSRTDDVPAGNQLRPFLGELARTHGCQRITLAPLSRDAVASMGSGREISAEALYRRTNGNPFFVTELLATDDELPASVSDAVLGRWARLSAGARVVVQTVAALGPTIAIEVVTSVIGSDAPIHIEEAIAGGLLCVVPDGVGFRHELTRDAMFESISPVRRIGLYRSILETLHERYPDFDPAWMAHYATGANDRAAIRTYSVRAAERAAAMGANREAVLHFQRALEAATDQPMELRVPIMVAYANATSNTGWVTENLRVRSELIDYFRETGDRSGEIEQLRELTTSHFNAGNNAAGEAAIRQAVMLLRELPEDHLHARVYATRAATLMLDRRSGEAIDWGRRAIRLAEHHGDALTVVRAQNAIGSAQIVSGQLEEGVATLEAGIAAAKQAGAAAIAVNLLSNLGSAAGEIYALNTAEPALLLAIEEARAADIDGLLSYALAWLALVRLFQGRWSESTQLSADALATPHALAISQIMALTALGRVRARRGDPDVWEALDRALEMAEPTGTLQRIAPVAAARAEARWLAGDLQGTAEEAMRGYDLSVSHRHAWHAGELTYWLRMSGNAVSPPFGIARPWELHLSGELTAAAAEWEQLGCPYEAARVRLDSNEVDELRLALRSFELLGARPMALRASQRLRELGVASIPRGPRRSTRVNPAGLTNREMEVLELMRDGSTNTEIGSALFVSARTVEHHVSSILLKLEAASRRDAVDIAVSRGILSP